MKKISVLLIAVSFAAVPAMAQHEVECSFTSISSNITSNTTLSASTLYRLEGCIHVTDGHTLTIPAGTKIMGQKSSGATLIIDRGAQLVSQGTSGSPVVFTSDQQPTYRNPGDWGGIVVLGKATNNQSNSITIENRTCSFTGGGNADNDNSGVLKYMRIEYPAYGLSLVSVGNATEFHDVQVSYAGNDAFEFYGGTVNANRLIALDAKASDMVFKFGNRSKLQYAINMRLDGSQHVSSGDKSNSIVMGNNDASPNYTGSPATHPVLSNISVLGPLYCGATGISSDFQNAVLYYHNTEGGVYNSLVAGWPTGLRMQDASTLNNADANLTLNFFENSFYANTTDYSNSGTWPASCATDMQDWIEGTAAGSCAQPNNQFSVVTLGYNSNICTYTSATPTFTLSGSSTLATGSFPSGSDLDNVFFNTASQKHGALNTSTDWTSSWAEWAPQSRDYCPQLRGVVPTGISNTVLDNAASLQLAPNPAGTITYAQFTTEKAGKVEITVTNSVGQVVRTISRDISKGSQRIGIATDGLSTGMYLINVTAPGNAAMHCRLIVK